MRVSRIVPRLLPVLVLAVFATAALAVPAPDDEPGMRKKALELNNVTGNDAIVGKVTELVDDAVNTKKMLIVAGAMLKEKDQPFNVNALYVLARAAHRLKDYDSGQVFYRTYANQALKLQSGQRLGQAFGGLIDMLYEAKKYDESVKVCKEFLEIDLQGDDNVQRLKPVVLRRMIQGLARQGKGDDALKLVENLLKAQPENWLMLELKGWVLRETDKGKEAAKIYEDVLDRISKDKNLTKEEQAEFGAEIRYLLSSVYIDNKEIDKASEHLKVLLAKEPDNPSFNNDLGYIWADHDMKLDEAEKLIRKAIEQERKQRKKLKPDNKDDRDNAAYLDSLGWVLFKQKKFKEAKEQLLLATKDKEGQHVEIFDHLGDVLMALGEKADAVAAWKKGVEMAGDNKREQTRKAEVEKKIKANE